MCCKSGRRKIRVLTGPLINYDLDYAEFSGNRIALTLLHELRRRGGGVGVAALGGAGGQGDALVVRAG